MEIKKIPELVAEKVSESVSFKLSGLVTHCKSPVTKSPIIGLTTPVTESTSPDTVHVISVSVTCALCLQCSSQYSAKPSCLPQPVHHHFQLSFSFFFSAFISRDINYKCCKTFIQHCALWYPPPPLDRVISILQQHALKELDWEIFTSSIYSSSFSPLSSLRRSIEN